MLKWLLKRLIKTNFKMTGCDITISLYPLYNSFRQGYQYLRQQVPFFYFHITVWCEWPVHLITSPFNFWILLGHFRKTTNSSAWWIIIIFITPHPLVLKTCIKTNVIKCRNDCLNEHVTNSTGIDIRSKKSSRLKSTTHHRAVLESSQRGSNAHSNKR